MSIDKATVAKIARLARIHVAEADQDALAGELSNILGWVEQLAEVDTDGVAPMTSVVEMTSAHMIWPPCVAIFIAVLSYNLVGDALRDAVDPRVAER